MSNSKLITKKTAIYGTIIGGIIFSNYSLPKYFNTKVIKDMPPVKVLYSELKYNYTDESVEYLCKNNNIDEITKYIDHLIETDDKDKYLRTLRDTYEYSCNYNQLDIIKVLITKYYFVPTDNDIEYLLKTNNHTITKYLFGVIERPSLKVIECMTRYNYVDIDFDLANIMLTTVLHHYPNGKSGIVNDVLRKIIKQRKFGNIFESLMDTSDRSIGKDFWDSVLINSTIYDDYKLFTLVIDKHLCSNLRLPFKYACIYDHLDMVKYIIQKSNHELDVESGFIDAYERGHYDIIEYMCDHHNGAMYIKHVSNKTISGTLTEQLRIKQLLNKLAK